MPIRPFDPESFEVSQTKLQCTDCGQEIWDITEGDSLNVIIDNARAHVCTQALAEIVATLRELTTRIIDLEPRNGSLARMLADAVADLDQTGQRIHAQGVLLDWPTP